MNKIYYKWDNRVKVITTAVILLFITLFIFIPFHISNLLYQVIFTLPLYLLFAYLILNIPLYVSIDNDRIVIKKILGRIVIENKNIIYVSLITRGQLTKLKRKFGSGGFGGYWGVFENPILGEINMYISNYKDIYLVQTKTKKYVIPLIKTDREG